MDTYQNLVDSLGLIENKIHYKFQDQSHLLVAFTHKSFLNENRELKLEHNERLEFLGDAVFGFIITEYLFQQFPSHQEGDLSYLRSRIIEGAPCSIYFEKLELGDYILLGKGEMQNTGRGRQSIYSDLFEALMAAIYLDGGIGAVKEFFFSHFEKEVLQIVKNPELNWKAVLQDYAQRKSQQKPEYRITDQEGPDHDKIFYVEVLIGEKVLGKGSGASKKQAEQRAAEDACNELGVK